jgi:hypothetical protein
MIIIPKPYYAEIDNKEFTSLIEPDNNGEWAVRYIWIQHTKDNEAFCKNYFDPSMAEIGLNVRKSTTHLKKNWDPHNQIFIDSAANGDLVWRIKTYNPISQSIDYIEIWKSLEVLERYFGTAPKPKLTDNIEWDPNERLDFNRQLYEAGFDARTWVPYQTISKELTLTYWRQFVEKWKNKNKCIINTPWNRELNPL